MADRMAFANVHVLIHMPAAKCLNEKAKVGLDKGHHVI